MHMHVACHKLSLSSKPPTEPWNVFGDPGVIVADSLSSKPPTEPWNPFAAPGAGRFSLSSKPPTEPWNRKYAHDPPLNQSIK